MYDILKVATYLNFDTLHVKGSPINKNLLSCVIKLVLSNTREIEVLWKSLL